MYFLLSFICFSPLLHGVGARPTQHTPRAVSRDVLNDLSFMEQYAAAAYCTENNEPGSNNQVTCNVGNCPEVEAAGATTLIEYQNVGSADATGFVAVDHTNSLIVLAFRGSKSVRNWLANVNIAMVPWEFCVGCLVHAGFLDSWTETREIINSTLVAAMQNWPDYRVVTTGHSLGAAIATIASGELRSYGIDADHYGYGSPMTGNVAFVNYVTSDGTNYRTTHKEDIVPKLPGYALGYAHISPEYWITSKSGVPVTTQDIKVSSGAINVQGNEGTLNSSVDDHSWYFNNISACGPESLELFR